DKHCIADSVADARRRVPWRRHHLEFKLSHRNGLAVLKEPVEIGAVGLQVIRLEHRSEPRLNLANAGPDPDFRSSAAADMISGRQMIRMRVCLEHPGNA